MPSLPNESVVSEVIARLEDGRAKNVPQAARQMGWPEKRIPELRRWLSMQHISTQALKPATVSASDYPDDEHSIPVGPTFTEDRDGARASVNSETIHTLDELLTACKVDLTIWKVDRHTVKTYQGYRRDENRHLIFDKGRISGTADDDGHIRLVTMYSITAYLSRREEVPYIEAIHEALAELKARSPKHKAIARRASGDHLLIPVLTDIHSGRRTIDDKYPPAKTASDMASAGKALIDRTLSMGMKIERVLFPIGGDAINADGLNNATTRGTPQEMSADIREAASAVSGAYIDLVRTFAELAPVDVVEVEGNHDRLSSYFLGLILEAYFKNDERVTVDASRGPRKYYRYGVNLIGMEHGDRVKPEQLAGIMAQEVPQLWGVTKYRTFLRGHFHHQREQVYMVNGLGAMTIITFPAFCPPDEWEAVMGYLGSPRAAEGRLYHREHGLSATYPIFIDELNTNHREAESEVVK